MSTDIDLAVRIETPMIRSSAIQQLRGLAVLLVVLFHASLLLPDASHGPSSLNFWLTFNGGYSGVYIFFVLSAYIVLRSHWTERGTGYRSAARFLWKRVSRIYPPTLVTVISLLTFIPLLRFLSEDPNFIEYPDGAILASLTLLPFSCSQVPGVLWSLSLELTFYLICLTLYVGGRTFFTVLLLWTLASFAAKATFFSAGWASACGNSPLSLYSLVFLVGALTFIFESRLKNIRNIPPKIFIFVGLSLLLISHVLHIIVDNTSVASVTDRKIFKAMYVILIAWSTALMIIGAARQLSDSQGIVGQVLLHLGNASFSIYLVHQPLQGFLFRLVPSTAIQSIGESIMLSLVLVAAGLAAGMAFYLTFERPLLSVMKYIVFR